MKLDIDKWNLVRQAEGNGEKTIRFQTKTY